MSGKCDFCSAPDPDWIYPAGNFDMTPEAWASVGAWAACDRCSVLIERKRWDELAEIGMDTQAKLIAALGPGGRAAVKPEVLRLHEKFRHERRGPRRAFG